MHAGHCDRFAPTILLQDDRSIHETEVRNGNAARKEGHRHRVFHLLGGCKLDNVFPITGCTHFPGHDLEESQVDLLFLAFALNLRISAVILKSAIRCITGQHAQSLQVIDSINESQK